MRNLLLLFLAILVSACGTGKFNAEMSDPDNELTASLYQTESGEIAYTVAIKGETVIEESTIGFQIRGQEYLGSNLKLVDVQESTNDEL